MIDWYSSREFLGKVPELESLVSQTKKNVARVNLAEIYWFPS